MNPESILPLTPEKRAELIEKLWRLPRIQASSIDFGDLEDLSDQEILEWLHMTEQGTNARAGKPGPKPKAKTPAPRKIAESYLEHEGRLMRRQVWRDHTGREEVTMAPCGSQVWLDGRRRSAHLVLHWLRTGVMLDRMPKVHTSPKRLYRAVARIEGRVKHIGYYATIEERDQALALVKMGLMNPGKVGESK